MAGLLGEMGCDLPYDQSAAAEMNAKGFFESTRITTLNEDILASAGMTWFDLNRFPDSWYASPRAPEFRKRASPALLGAFGGSRQFVMKDPRNCRLIPFWEDILAGQEVQPVYVCIHRDPGEVAASLMRWAGYEPLYGQVLWLRHVLDAEIATRGRKRIFITYDQLLSDWREVVGRISSQLDLVFPRSIQTAARGVQDFLNRDLKHLSSTNLAIPRIDERSDWLADTSEILSRWSRAGESPSDHATLDHVREAMNAASDTMVPVFDELLARYRELERARQRHTEATASVAVLSAQMEAQDESSRQIEANFQERLDVARQEHALTIAVVTSISAQVESQNEHNKQLETHFQETLERARQEKSSTTESVTFLSARVQAQNEYNEHLEESLQDERERLAAFSAQVEEAKIALANSEASLNVVRDSLHMTWLHTQALRNELNIRTDELRKSRRRPLTNLRKYVEFKALRMLSSRRSPFPLDMKSRFVRSANKRNPDRGLTLNENSIKTTGNETPDILSGHGQAAYRPDLPTVIIVTHDASRSGAPILALNLAKAISPRYNIVIICLRAGDLVAAFRQVSMEVYVAEHAGGTGSYFTRTLDIIAAQKTPIFAIVNSIESRNILGALRERQIPSVALFHEFASYTLPKSAFADAFSLADEVVFSTELTIQNAMERTSFVRTPRFHVLAQGRCEVPRRESGDAVHQMERDSLTAVLRPDANKADEFLVIGAGYVQMRKGVDLFIDVARRVLSTEEGRNARFAWIGAGYDPEHDAVYSVYLRDQIERAGLNDRMMMLGETAEIEHVYALSDLLLLTSRLDPLPNVAIDALSEGVPVICFEKTTGIADLLAEAGLRDACVADYLDTGQAADRVLRFIRSPEAYRQVSVTSKAFAMRAFDFGDYASRIEQLGLRVGKSWSLHREEVSTIAGSDAFDPAFLMPGHVTASTKTEAAGFYLTGNRLESIPRRPEPGFNPLIYARHLEAEGANEIDAYAEFLRRGRPSGQWLKSVIRQSASVSLREGQLPLKTALHIHAHFPDVVAAIAERLALNRTQPDLFINAGDRKSLNVAVGMLKGYRGRIAEARVVVNRGRDLGPFLTEFGKELVRDYDLIGHVHTKKSPHLPDRQFADHWVRFLYENMLGGPHGGAMMDRIVAAFTENERLGIVFPADPHILAWSSNEDAASKLAPQLGLGRLPEFIDFPVGSMFWLRAAALAPFVALNLGWNVYPPEPVRIDGTILHAMERLFGLVTENRGLDVAVTNVKGVTR